MDTKKKELVGDFKDGGLEWQPEGRPEEVQVHDFPDPRVGEAIPYGVDDPRWDRGRVDVGVDHDAASSAVEGIRRWWSGTGEAIYPEARRLPICADGGGSDGYRARLWKVGLQAFADESGPEIAARHFPPGTSKWDKIEHRLLSHIAMNWRGRPLASHQVVVELTAATRGARGLEVEARLDTRRHPTKVRVTEEQWEQALMERHEFRGEWDYTIRPRAKVRKAKS